MRQFVMILTTLVVTYGCSTTYVIQAPAPQAMKETPPFSGSVPGKRVVLNYGESSIMVDYFDRNGDKMTDMVLLSQTEVIEPGYMIRRKIVLSKDDREHFVQNQDKRRLTTDIDVRMFFHFLDIYKRRQTLGGKVKLINTAVKILQGGVKSSGLYARYAKKE